MRSWTIAFALGVCAIDVAPALPEAWLLWLAGAVALCLQLQRYRFLRLVGALALGAAWSGGYGHWLQDHRLPASPSPQSRWLEGVVEGLPSATESYGKSTRHILFSVASESIDGRVWQAPTLRKVSLAWRGGPAVKAGERWRLRADLEQPHSAANPGGFDYEAYLFAQQVSASGKVREGERLSSAPLLSLPGLRQHLLDAMNAALAGSEFGRFAPALVLGVGDGLTQADWTLLQRTGTVHLFVVSGLQIGLVAGACYVIVRRLCRRWPGRYLLVWPAQRYASVVAALMGLGYALLAGFSLPTQRSAVIVLLAALLPALSRRIGVSHAACVALLAVLLLDPLCPLFPSVWLSCGAAAMLVYGFAGRLRAADWLQSALQAQWVSSWGMVPLLALMFGALTWGAPLANLLAVPVVNLVALPCAALAAMLAGAWPWLASWLWWPGDQAFGALWALLGYLAEAPGAWVWTGRAPGWIGLLAVIGVLWLLAPRGVPARVLGGLLLLPACASQPARLGLGEYRATVLDVGQGLAVYVETREHRLLFDTGRRDGNDSDSGQRVILPYLRARGERDLDVLILSHDDSDHTGGARAVLGEARVTRVLGGEAVEGVPQLEHCQEGMSWEWEGVQFSLLNPGGVFQGNDASCVLMVRGGGGAMIIPGDISARVEGLLLRYQLEHLHAEVLVAPHHGSRSSSSQNFAAVVAPDWVVYSAGHHNSYGHPHPLVLKRYESLGARALDTVSSGAISFDFAPGREVVVDAWRQRHAHYWE